MITFEDSKLLWNTFKAIFEITLNNQKFELKSRLSQIIMIEEKIFEQYFVEMQGINSELATIGVTMIDVDLVQIVMKKVLDSYDNFM